MNTIEQLASELKISKMTIYNKIKLMDDKLKGHILKENNVTLIDEVGSELIKNSISPKKFKRDETVKRKQEEQIEGNKDSFQFKLIETLEDQLKKKDKQIESLLRINENNQVLLREINTKLSVLEQPKEEVINMVESEPMQEIKEEVINIIEEDPVKIESKWRQIVNILKS